MTMLRHQDILNGAPSAQTRTGGIFAGSLILTDQGEMPIEKLKVGMGVLARDHGLATLRAISRRQVPAMHAIRVRPDSLGMGRPIRDVRVAPGQHLYLSDWRAQALFDADAALVPAFRLCDGNYVAEVAAQEALMFELHFSQDHIIYADGMEVGTGCTIDTLVGRVA